MGVVANINEIGNVCREVRKVVANIKETVKRSRMIHNANKHDLGSCQVIVLVGSGGYGLPPTVGRLICCLLAQAKHRSHTEFFRVAPREK